jgi:hypothetical protein
MTFHQPLRSSPAPDASPRSSSSLSFQDFWSGLRRSGPIPHRQDFSPAKAAGFLRDIVLIEVPDNCAGAMRVRVTGSAFDMRAGKSIAGHNYLDFVPEHLHGGLRKSVRLMLDHPCGLWQVMPMHYEKGIAQQAEVTAFPLLPADNGAPLLLCLVKFPGRPVRPISPGGKAMIVETATAYEFLDIGKGAPRYDG